MQRKNRLYSKPLTAVGVVEGGYSLRDDVVNVAGADVAGRGLVASVASVARQVVECPPRTLHRLNDALLQIGTHSTQALSQLYQPTHTHTHV